MNTKRATFDDIMSVFEKETRPPAPRRSVASLANHVWLYALAALLVPAITAWGLRGLGEAMGCMPSAKSCVQAPFDMLLGAALKGMLDLSWLVGANMPVTMALTLIAAFAAIIAARPIGAAATVLIAPLLALLAPVALVGSLTFSGCPVNAGGAGDCVLWGQAMGQSFHMAASAPDLIYSYTPLSVSGGVVAGLLAWIVHWGRRQMDRS